MSRQAHDNRTHILNQCLQVHARIVCIRIWDSSDRRRGGRGKTVCFRCRNWNCSFTKGWIFQYRRETTNFTVEKNNVEINICQWRERVFSSFCSQTCFQICVNIFTTAVLIPVTNALNTIVKTLNYLYIQFNYTFELFYIFYLLFDSK